MNKEISEIRTRILTAELEMSLIDNEIKRLELECIYFQAMIKGREENIAVLKKSEIICTIKGYKQSRDEAIFFREKLYNIECYLDKKKKELDNLEKSYNFYLERFDEVWEIIKNDKKVLEFRKRE